MRAYCSHCDELVPARQGGVDPRGDGRVRLVYPLPHPDRKRGKPWCSGVHENAGKSYFPECDVAPPCEIPRVELDESSGPTREIAGEMRAHLDGEE